MRIIHAKIMKLGQKAFGCNHETGTPPTRGKPTTNHQLGLRPSHPPTPPPPYPTESPSPSLHLQTLF